MGEIDKPDKVLNPASLSSRSEFSAAPTLDAGTTLDSSAPTIGSADHGATTPRSVGPYKLIKKLGEGGMGQVWLAQQTAPLERQVALKLIRVGMYDQQVLQRFASERQALAIMSHPSIAKVFDAGATPDGQPYFVMEYVPGLPLTEYCDEKRLKIRERLELFIEVCDGVQHAHQKAILHRDLKPANILVAEVDGKATPRIIDFGLAKVAAPQAGGETVFTRAGGWVGTPGYMSPEQADPDVLDVDTRTDVYSLGAVLYVLLTGFPPFETNQKQSFAMFFRRLRDEDPVLPSTKIDMQKENSNAAAEERGTEPGRLASLLHGDLDWITMKALDKDRALRYGTPSELAADIRRYLRHEPILARPASTGYRVLRYVRRHRAGVTIAAGLLLLLTAFAVTQALQLRRTTRERDRANRVTDFMTGMFKVSDPSEARGNTVTAREVLDKASKDVNVGLTQDPELQAQMMTVMGTIYDNLGLYARAESLLTSAVDIRRRVLGPQNPATLTSMDDLGWVLQEQGRYPEAEKLVREALVSRRRVLGPEHPDTLVSMNVLAKILQLEGHSPDSEKLNRETLDIRRRVLGPDHPQTLSSANNLAEVLAREGHSAEAEKLCREIVDGRRRSLGPEHPDTIAAMSNLAFVLQDQGHYAEAEKLNQETLDIRRRILGPEHPDTLGSMENLAIVLNSEGHSAEAEKLLSETLDIRRRILGPEHPDTAHSSYNLACIVALKGHREEALSLLREAIDHGLAPFVDLGIEKDTDLQSLHDDPRFAALVAHAKERAAAAQKAN